MHHGGLKHSFLQFLFLSECSSELCYLLLLRGISLDDELVGCLYDSS
jgi:hypothetical protein